MILKSSVLNPLSFSLVATKWCFEKFQVMSTKFQEGKFWSLLSQAQFSAAPLAGQGCGGCGGRGSKAGRAKTLRGSKWALLHKQSLADKDPC